MQVGPISNHESSTDFQVLIKGQMLDYYDISGCYILRPGSFNIWQTIQGTSPQMAKC
jgi:prolyl-tRNA synthetase